MVSQTKKGYYVNNAELERCWTEWRTHKGKEMWDRLTSDIYKICQGVAVKFNPRDPDEHSELTHEALVLTLEKIKDGRLNFIVGKAPAFNLLTTTIFRHLYSKMNKETRRGKVMAKLRQKRIDEQPQV